MTSRPPSISVGDLLRERSEAARLDVDVIAGAAGLDRAITLSAMQKTGLALAGFDQYLRAGRVLVFGESEIRYLEELAPDARDEAVSRVVARDIPCILITDGQTAPPELVEQADRAGLPLLRTALSTPLAIARLTTVLELRLAVRETVHGVLLDLIGLGVLVIGESGIGKSECALDLVVRGHRLVADDTVEIRKRGDAILIGTCPELTRHHMEIRGLGLINVRDLFGVASTRSSKRVELVVQLERWETGRAYDRLGLDEAFFEILGVRVPLIRMPVAPGRSVAILVEVAARNQLLRARGRHAARELASRLDQQLARAAAGEPPLQPELDSDDDTGRGEPL
jgi:HPr kinase/phosphorylase